ncbi:hypothetical protein E2C01_054918 [Portunus trituberculatus]|uniref:Uncharacterized protein n=1 Tax=Portunus trituberculatus TaxID=210409 RepID=A0A5B7GT82_PORTR|nr:hypothetical protein [Portunus trituberculatus]
MRGFVGLRWVGLAHPLGNRCPSYTRTVDRIRTRVLEDPSDPKACMVPLYHGDPLLFILFPNPNQRKKGRQAVHALLYRLADFPCPGIPFRFHPTSTSSSTSTSTAFEFSYLNLSIAAPFEV